MSESHVDRGMAVRRAVLGMRTSMPRWRHATDFTARLSALSDRERLGRHLDAAGLERKTRSMLVIAITAALGRLEERSCICARAGHISALPRHEVKELLCCRSRRRYPACPAAIPPSKDCRKVYRQSSRGAGP